MVACFGQLLDSSIKAIGVELTFCPTKNKGHRNEENNPQEQFPRCTFQIPGRRVNQKR